MDDRYKQETVLYECFKDDAEGDHPTCNVDIHHVSVLRGTAIAFLS